jgi:hypothetical protein
MNNRIDVNVSNHGGIFLFRPATTRGCTWLEENTEGTWFADALVVEHRYARDLADGMLADGLRVA